MQSHVIVRGIVLENDTLGISGKVPSVPFITIVNVKEGRLSSVLMLEHTTASSQSRSTSAGSKINAPHTLWLVRERWARIREMKAHEPWWRARSRWCRAVHMCGGNAKGMAGRGVAR